jgi:hypothetical protein
MCLGPSVSDGSAGVVAAIENDDNATLDLGRHVGDGAPQRIQGHVKESFLVVDGDDDTDRMGTTEGWLPTHSVRSHTFNTNSRSTW